MRQIDLSCRKHYLLRACAASFAMFFAGYLLMSAAPNIWLLIPSTIVRSCGSSIVWVYSTLLIQLRVPNQLQGRMMALEMAFYVVSPSSLDILGCRQQGVHLGAWSGQEASARLWFNCMTRAIVSG